MMFLVNDLFELYVDNNKRCERILWISPENNFCFTIDMLSESLNINTRQLFDLEELIKNGLAKIIEDDFITRLKPEDIINERNKQIRDKAFNAVKEIINVIGEPDIFDEKKRFKVIKETQRKLNISNATLYKYLKNYWKGGQIKDALLPRYDNCGGKDKEKTFSIKTGRKTYEAQITGQNNGVIIDEEIKKVFTISISRYYHNTKEISLRKTYELMIKDFFTEYIGGSKVVNHYQVIPTYKQFWYWFKKNYSSETTIKSRKGEKKFASDYKGLNSNTKIEAFSPGFRYQVDSTIADVFLVSRIDRTSVIGRPVVYLAVDVFSRLITGVHIALEGPSWEGASSLIYNCYENKVDFCNKYGIQITDDDWPARGLPEVIIADRGELVGPLGEKLVVDLGISLENTPSYRGDAKGIVEQNFRILNSNIRDWSPGAVKKEFRERGERDYRLDAKLDIYQFSKIIIHSILHRNKCLIKDYVLEQEMINDRISAIPVELWSWGLKNKTGSLRSVPLDLLRLKLMKSGRATITERGIKFKNVLYSTSIAEGEGWYTNARINGVSYITIVYDKRDLSIIYIVSENKFIPCKVKNTNDVFENKTYEEIVDL
ncbi:Mu transposase C-terminal domain-containing protein [Clostridium formicaceticum]|uniref:Transposon Tn7 transposition protein TnsB n=1 Tax=Clostridium formicaceticum TaxID=1497 RepID=A0AAC9WHW6_9CLOT|nr:Mu transposase C-terminal domain-containing protein [Clostridium formicaceticum]AOY75001.1 hypothetical protein BJL90_02910 [Clostridium formicaceticum]ARE89416.1 Transposon Tn7 transposition protein TnsB [Clostridium formicaceticum]